MGNAVDYSNGFTFSQRCSKLKHLKSDMLQRGFSRFAYYSRENTTTDRDSIFKIRLSLSGFAENGSRDNWPRRIECIRAWSQSRLQQSRLWHTHPITRPQPVHLKSALATPGPHFFQGKYRCLTLSILRDSRHLPQYSKSRSNEAEFLYKDSSTVVGPLRPSAATVQPFQAPATLPCDLSVVEVCLFRKSEKDSIRFVNLARWFCANSCARWLFS